MLCRQFQILLAPKGLECIGSTTNTQRILGEGNGFGALHTPCLPTNTHVVEETGRGGWTKRVGGYCRL